MNDSNESPDVKHSGCGGTAPRKCPLKSLLRLPKSAKRLTLRWIWTKCWRSTAALIKRHIDYEIFGVLMFER